MISGYSGYSGFEGFSGLSGAVGKGYDLTKSSSEIDTGKKWINGKKIYSKSFSISVSNHNWWYIPIALPSGFDDIIRVMACYENGNGVYYSGNSKRQLWKIDVYDFAVAGQGPQIGTVTIEYTKK